MEIIQLKVKFSVCSNLPSPSILNRFKLTGKSITCPNSFFLRAGSELAAISSRPLGSIEKVLGSEPLVSTLSIRLTVPVSLLRASLPIKI